MTDILIDFGFWTAVICGALSLMCWVADKGEKR